MPKFTDTQLVILSAAARNAAAWREGEDGQRMMLVITDTGLQAFDGEPTGESSKQPTPSKARAKKPRRRIVQKPTAATPKGKKSQTAARPGTKQALLINLLKRKKGTTIKAIVETLDWLPHTVRAALTRLRQQGFQIERVREDGVSCYRIAEDRKAA